MKKIALFLLISAMTLTALTACGDNGDTTTKGSTNSGGATNSTPAQTTLRKRETTTTNSALRTTPATSEDESPDTPEPTGTPIDNWLDNNQEDPYYPGGKTFYEITKNEDGSFTVDYTKEPASECEAHYGYAGTDSWANMKADISEIYTGQTKLVMKVKGESGRSLMIKPFDSTDYQQTLTFDGTDQEITLDLSNPPADANKVIILFGDGGAADVTGTFTILEAYLAD